MFITRSKQIIGRSRALALPHRQPLRPAQSLSALLGALFVLAISLAQVNAQTAVATGAPIFTTVSATGEAKMFNHAGGEITNFAANYTSGDGFAAGDVNGDGVDEIVIGGDFTGAIDIFRQDGSLLNSFGGFYTFEDSLALGDVDGDGTDEILVAGDWLNAIDIFDQSGAKLESSFGAAYSTGDGFAVGDVDGDGNDEVVIAGDLFHMIDVWNAGGAPGVSFLSAYSIGDGFGVGDVNADGVAEIIVASQNLFGPSDSGVIIYTGDGDELASFRATVLDHPQVAVGDVDADGTGDILIGAAGSVSVYNIGGVQLNTFAATVERLAVGRVTFPDQDGDGLSDQWETIGIDQDGNGTIELDLAALGADPQRVDVFIEIDCLISDSNGDGDVVDFGDHTHCPRQASLQTVAQAFANAPINNPDGTTGIQLHIDTGALYGAGVVTTVPGTVPGSVSGVYGDFGGGGDQIPEAGNQNVDFEDSGTATDFYSLKDPNFDPRRAPVFHYALFAHQLDPSWGCTSGRAEGGAESLSGGNDLIVSLGGQRDLDNDGVTDRTCWPTPIDNIDNDGDGQTDEDPFDSIDNDGDGQTDEDGGMANGIDEDNDGATDEDPRNGIDDDGDCVPGTDTNNDGVTCGPQDVGVDEDGGFSVGDLARETGTFMHELGHNLGLGHGGGDEANFKPNYFSVMNYAVDNCSVPQVNVPGLVLPGGCDFSRIQMDLLSELISASPYPGNTFPGLDECLGISANNGAIPAILGPADFDADGNITGASCVPVTANVSADINADGALGLLAGFDDWANLKFNFRNDVNFQDGSAGTYPVEATIDQVEQMQARFKELIAPEIVMQAYIYDRDVSTKETEHVYVGHTLVHVLTVSNRNGGPAHNIRLRATLEDNSPVEFSLDSLAANTDSEPATVDYFVPPDAEPGSFITNAVEVTYEDALGNQYRIETAFNTRVIGLADFAVGNASLSCDSSAGFKEEFGCSLNAEVWNNGLTPKAQGKAVVNLSVPSGCDVEPVGPFEYELTELTGTPYPISIDFKLACNVLGNHNISASVVAALDQQWVEDLVDTNDAVILTDNVPVTAAADLQIEMLDLNCETPALPYTPFKCQADVTIINGGPYHPANADLAVTLSGPDTCSLTSGPATQFKNNITLGNQSQLIELVWQASCSAGTFWPASAVAELTVDQAYVSDPEPESNILEYVSLNILTHPKLGLVDVSIFSVPDYIVTKRLDWNSFTFGRTGYEHSLIGCSSVDINGDRLVDLQCQFSGSATGLDPETYELGMLRGWSQDGAAVIGRDNMPDSSGKPQKR